jgi:hypothetical protein
LVVGIEGGPFNRIQYWKLKIILAGRCVATRLTTRNGEFSIDKGRYHAVGGSLGLRWDDYSGKLIHELDCENLSLFGFTTIYKRAEVA